MSIWDEITGKSQKKAAQSAGEAFASNLASGKAAAGRYLDTGAQDQLGYTNAGYRQARDEITGTRDWLHKNVWTPTAQNISGNINAGFGDAASEIRNTRDRIQGYFNPMLTAGNDATARWRQFMGLDGPDAAKMAYEQFDSADPNRDFRNQRTLRAIEADLNARGLSDSGRSRLAGTRVLQENFQNDVNSHLNRLYGATQLGNQAAGQAAGFDASLGGRLADLSVGRGQALAQNDARHAGALSDLYGNNAIATGQLALGQGRDQSNIAGQYYGSKANNENGVAAQLANNASQMELVKGMPTGLNNMLQFAGVLGKGFTPSSNGTSAFGNIASGLKSFLPFG